MKFAELEGEYEEIEGSFAYKQDLTNINASANTLFHTKPRANRSATHKMKYKTQTTKNKLRLEAGTKIRRQSRGKREVKIRFW